MGNALRRASDDPIDGGSVRRISSDRSSASSPIEYDPRLVKKLILARRMAPFYEGKAEVEEGSTTRESPPSSPASASSLEFTTDSSESSSLPPSKKRRHRRIFSRGRKDKRPADGLPADLATRQLLNSYQTECPICFLYFPQNINHTSCCQQSLCTDCFLNLRRPPSGRTISCPFCNRRDLAISYRPPHVLVQEEGLPAADRERLFRPNPVKWESLRPYRPPPPPASAAYRAATVSSRYAHYAGPPFSVRSGGRTTTYGRGVLVLYDANGRPTYVTEEYPSPAARQQSATGHHAYGRTGAWNAPAISRTRYAGDLYYRPGQYAYPGQSYRYAEGSTGLGTRTDYRYMYPMAP